MYPTTVSYRTQYLFILIATAIAKLFMFVIFRTLNKKSGSDILKVISTDCILDFFITSVTAMTLLISTYGSYAADAICGIVISFILTVSAIKMVFSAFSKLIGYIPGKKREAFLNILFESLDEKHIEDIRFCVTNSRTEAYVSTTEHLTEEELNNIRKQTGITVYIILRKENTETSV